MKYLLAFFLFLLILGCTKETNPVSPSPGRPVCEYAGQKHTIEPDLILICG